MRVAILTVFVICCALSQVTYGQLKARGGRKPLDQDKWGEVSEIVESHLVKLGNEGHQFKLVALKSVESQVVSGTKYFATADFENGTGDQVTCDFELWVQPWTEYEALQLTCNEQTYQVTKGQLSQ